MGWPWGSLWVRCRAAVGLVVGPTCVNRSPSPQGAMPGSPPHPGGRRALPADAGDGAGARVPQHHVHRGLHQPRLHHQRGPGGGALRRPAPRHPPVERECLVMGQGLLGPPPRRSLPHSVPLVSPQVGSYRDISHESLSLFRLLEPQIGTWGSRGPGLCQAAGVWLPLGASIALPQPTPQRPASVLGEGAAFGILLLCSCSWRGTVGQEGHSRAGFPLVWAAVGELLLPAGRAGLGRGRPSCSPLPVVVSRLQRSWCWAQETGWSGSTPPC